MRTHTVIGRGIRVAAVAVGVAALRGAAAEEVRDPTLAGQAAAEDTPSAEVDSGGAGVGQPAPWAVVVSDSADRRSIHGTLQVAEVYSARMLEPNVRRLVADGAGSLLQNPQAVPNLVEAVNEYTDIETRVVARFAYGSRELLGVPWVFVPRLRFTLDEAELRNLGRYLASGGFLLADAGVAVGGNEDVSIRHAVRQALASTGRGARFERLPATHPVYRAYFDFDGPPRALLDLPEAGGTGAGRNSVDYIVGVAVDGHLAVAITYQDLGAAWESASSDNSRHLQFGINTIVFALTQAGSIARKGAPIR